ncbi:hypothetical protein DDB_G0281411 [Dictyostelium discoideum AX4]|uniref:hypothetical protein n=1 Tax=Dictyostelium discoideum AX4 TaxID=352472 RepID=UPI00004E3762|nr:hypothetical protein DDB_G0281411 [Dictyostelium discoideum AX4]EAL66687.1 hypothetical protein DDB_G0281411 [Dictyostelium discoideum AX4]|eukprot:XP_640658.1 hypothetical protein DDB_G0281411 [Dictyostelium discoideum AX4]
MNTLNLIPTFFYFFFFSHIIKNLSTPTHTKKKKKKKKKNEFNNNYKIKNKYYDVGFKKKILKNVLLLVNFVKFFESYLFFIKIEKKNSLKIQYISL